MTVGLIAGVVYQQIGPVHRVGHRGDDGGCAVDADRADDLVRIVHDAIGSAERVVDRLRDGPLRVDVQDLPVLLVEVEVAAVAALIGNLHRVTKGVVLGGDRLAVDVRQQSDLAVGVELLRARVEQPQGIFLGRADVRHQSGIAQRCAQIFRPLRIRFRQLVRARVDDPGAIADSIDDIARDGGLRADRIPESPRSHTRPR